MRGFRLTLFVLCLLVGLQSAETFAQKSFIGRNFPPYWSDPDNWSPTGVPTPLEPVTIPSPDLLMHPLVEHVILTENASCGPMLINEGTTVVLEDYTLTINGDFRIENSVSSAIHIDMRTPAATLIINGDATFAGRISLEDGTILIRGNFLQIFRDNAVQPLLGNRNGTFIFGADTTQTVEFRDPTVSYFRHVIIDNPQGVVFNSDVHVRGQLTVEVNATVFQEARFNTFYDRLLPQVKSSGYYIENTVVNGLIRMTENRALPEETQLRILPSAHIDLQSHELLVGGDFTIDDHLPGSGVNHLIMNSPTAVLTIGGNATIGSSTSLADGKIYFRGNLEQRFLDRALQLPLGNGRMEFIFDGADSQFVRFEHPEVSRFRHVRIHNPAGVFFETDVQVAGELVVENGGLLAQDASLSTFYTRVLPHEGEGSYHVANTCVNAHITMTEPRRLPSTTHLKVLPGLKSITLNKNSLTVEGDFTIEDNLGGGGPHLVMNDSADVLTIKGTATIGSSTSLSGGVINLQGDFVQRALSFGVQPRITEIVFNGQEPQSVRFAHPNDSYFRNVKIQPIATVVFDTDARILGEFNNYGTVVIPANRKLSLRGVSATNHEDALLQGNGDIEVTATTFSNAGTVSPGDSPGRLTFLGNYAQTATGVFSVEVGGRQQIADFDLLNITGAANLDGKLEVRSIRNFTPVIGDSFRVVSYNSVAGSFSMYDVSRANFIPIIRTNTTGVDLIVHSLKDNQSTEHKLLANDGMAGDVFGESVALWGNTVIVGAPLEDGKGAAYFYDWDGSAWRQSQKLTASNGVANDQFGQSVAISAHHVVVAAPQHDNGKGMVYIFEREANGGDWMETHRLVASDGAAKDIFGNSLALSCNDLIVGAPFQNDAGAAYVFARDHRTGAWHEQAKLLASDGAGDDLFGHAVSISGNYAIVTSPQDDDQGNASGSAYVFQRSTESGWREIAKLTASDGVAGDNFGAFTVDLDGPHALVGAFQNGGKGAAYVFQRGESGWHEAQKLTASDGNANDFFGVAVALAGNYAIIAADQQSEIAQSAGAAYIFRRGNDGMWDEHVKLTASDAEFNDRFGHAVDLNGSRAIVGALNEDEKGAEAGAAYVYSDFVIDGVLFASTCHLDFGTIAVGGMASADFKLSNVGSAAISVDSLAIIGNDAASFMIESSAFVLAPEAERNLVVVFNPAMIGEFEAVLNLNSAASAPAIEILLTGRAETIVSVDEAAEAEIPAEFALAQNHPNPFNPSTTLRFALAEAGDVSLAIYNLNGQLVREVVNGWYENGRHSVVWDGRNEARERVPSGVYLYRLKAGEFVAKKKLVLMK